MTDNVLYLHNSGVTIDGASFFGVPMLAEFAAGEMKPMERYEIIPDRVAVLVTHRSPLCILDRKDCIYHISAAVLDHSGHGIQYACCRYVDTLVEHHIRIGMTECYKPTDNAIAERMWCAVGSADNGILKVEWLYRQEIFANHPEAEQGISDIIHFYNYIRPHMSICMKTPMEVYQGDDPGKNLWEKDKDGSALSIVIRGVKRFSTA